MDLLLLLVAVGLVGVVAAVATGRIGGELSEPVRSRPDRTLPEGPLTGRDIEGMDFDLAFRGYRMDEVDHALDRLRDELDRRDARIAELELSASVPADDPAEQGPLLADAAAPDAAAPDDPAPDDPAPDDPAPDDPAPDDPAPDDPAPDDPAADAAAADATDELRADVVPEDVADRAR